MASTTQGRRLTEEHRRAQVALRARFLTGFLLLWPLLDWRRLDDTAPGWVQAVLALLRPFRQESADLAVSYYRDYRLVEVPQATDPVPEVEFVQPAPTRPLTSSQLLDELARRRRLGAQATRSVPPSAPPRRAQPGELVKPRIDWSEWDKAAERSLSVTGPGELKRQASRGIGEGQARRVALVTSSGAATRHVLTGARETTLTLVQNDQRALGWARVTDSDPCSFCAMLASRGPAYKTETSASFKAHDQCACVPVAVYSRAAAWPGDARAYQRLWYEATKGTSGKDSINAFRRAYEAQRREQGRTGPAENPLSA